MLVFLPGFSDITALLGTLTGSRRFGDLGRFRVLPLAARHRGSNPRGPLTDRRPFKGYSKAATSEVSVLQIVPSGSAALPLQDLLVEDLSTNTCLASETPLKDRVRKAALGECDAFMSHR